MADGAGAEGLPDPAEVERPWLQAYPPAVPARYAVPDVALPRLLDDAAHDFPDLVAVDHRGYQLTYRELVDRVDRLASALADLGVGVGVRVGLLLPTVPQHVIALFAVWRCGAAAVEIGVDADSETVGRRLDDTGCRVVVCWDAAYDRLAALKGRLGTVVSVIGTGAADYAPVLRSALALTRGEARRGRVTAEEGVLRFRDLVGRSAPAPAQVPVDPATAPALLAYPRRAAASGGALVLTHRNLVASAFQTRLWIPDVKAGQESVLCAVPFTDAYGVAAGLGLGVLSAATLVLEPRSDGDALRRAVSRRHPTLVAGTPAVFAALLDGGRRADLSSLRACLASGGPLAPGVADEFEVRTGARLRAGYGRSAAPLTHANPVYGLAKPGTVGLPLPDTSSVLVDLEHPDRLASPATPGQLAVAGPQVSHGYWHRPAATAAAMRGSWVLTGDVATVDGDGYVSVLGPVPSRARA